MAWSQGHGRPWRRGLRRRRRRKSGVRRRCQSGPGSVPHLRRCPPACRGRVSGPHPGARKADPRDLQREGFDRGRRRSVSVPPFTGEVVRQGTADTSHSAISCVHRPSYSGLPRMVHLHPSVVAVSRDAARLSRSQPRPGTGEPVPAGRGAYRLRSDRTRKISAHQELYRRGGRPDAGARRVAAGYGERTSSQLRVLEDKQTQASDRVSEFERYGRERIEKFISGQISSIHDEIPSFSEENYDRGDAGERWSEFLESRNLERKAEKLAEKLSDDFRREVAELAREIEAETGFADDFAAARRISMGSVFDGMRAWKWTTISLSSVLAIAAVFPVSGPLGWASVAVGVVGWLVSQCLDDREAKVRRQRSELARRLRGNADEIERRLRKHLLRWFTEELLPEAGRLLRDLSAVTEALFELAHRQRELAWTLNRELKKLHRALVREALAQLGRPDLIASTRNLDFARVPGLAVMLLIPPGMKFPEKVRAALGDLLGERIWFVVDTDDRISILRQAIGMDCDRYRISIDEENRVARVPAGEIRCGRSVSYAARSAIDRASRDEVIGRRTRRRPCPPSKSGIGSIGAGSCWPESP